MEQLQTLPAKLPPEESEGGSRNMDKSYEIGTTRELVDRHIERHGQDYGGRDYSDMYITAAMLAEIGGYSKEKARKALKYFSKRGILVEVIRNGRESYYALSSEYTGRDSDTVKSRVEAVDTVKDLLNSAQTGISRQRYWELFDERVEDSDVLEASGEWKGHYYKIPKDGPHLSFHTKLKRQDVSVSFVIGEIDGAERIYDYLKSKSRAIESELGYEVEWLGPEDSLTSEYARITDHHPDEDTFGNISESPDEYLDWLLERGEDFERAFDPHFEDAVIEIFQG